MTYPTQFSLTCEDVCAKAFVPKCPRTVPAQGCAQCCPEAAVGSAPAQHSDPKEMQLEPGTGEISTGKQTPREMGQKQQRRKISEAADTWAERTGNTLWDKVEPGLLERMVKLQNVQKEGKKR